MAKYKIIPSSRTIVQSPISIGHKAEKGVEAIEFDLTAWVETYGSGTLTVIMRRWGDAIPYPIALEIDENNKATWTLSDIDTAKAGMAYAQLNYIVGETVVKKSDIYTFRVMDSLTGEGEPPEAYESWLEHLTHLAAEAMAEVLDIESIVTDKTLTVDGGIADAKKTGDEISQIKADLDDLDDRVDALESGGDGLTDAVKTALMNLVNHIVWDDDDPTGQTYITALYNALYPPADLVSISAVYTQPGKVYSTNTLDSLKSDLVVTALMSDSSTRIVTEYTLSGTLAEGTSVITVTYGGKTTTFNVVVSSHLLYSLYNHEFTGDPSISPYINTGVQLFDEDFSWTIICELNKETASPHGWRLFNALRGTSPYNGFYHGSSNDTKTGSANVKWVDATTSNANTYMKGDWTGTYKCAFVHNFGSGLSEYFKGDSDSVVTKSLSNVWSQVSDAVPLGIGGVPGDTLNYALIGTIVKCEIYDYAFNSSEINAFMEGAS